MLSFLRGVCLWKEGDMQGLSSTTCAPAAASLEVNSALPLAQAIALRMYSYCKMVLANPLWAEVESSFGTRKHTLIQPHPQKGLGWFKYLGCRKVTFVTSCTGIKYFFYKYWQETKIRGSSLWKWLALRTVFLWSQAFIHLISPVPIHHHTRTPSLSSLYCTCCWCRWGAETALREAETYVLYGSLNSAELLLSCFLRASFLPHFFSLLHYTARYMRHTTDQPPRSLRDEGVTVGSLLLVRWTTLCLWYLKNPKCCLYSQLTE